EDRRDVDPHRPHEHARHDLVTVRDADHAVEHVGVDHRLYTVGDELARGERVLHPLVAHGDPVVDADGVEQERDAAGGTHAFLHEVADDLEVDVPGDDVDVTVADRDERLVPVGFGYAGGTEQAAVGGPGVALLDRVGTHGVGPRFGGGGVASGTGIERITW